MEENSSITIQIANRSYSLKINPSEETVIQEAAAFISQRLAVLQQSHGIKDHQDMLAMFALQYATEQLKRKSTSETEQNEGLQRIEMLQEKLGSYINSI